LVDSLYILKHGMNGWRYHVRSIDFNKVVIELLLFIHIFTPCRYRVRGEKKTTLSVTRHRHHSGRRSRKEVGMHFDKGPLHGTGFTIITIDFFGK